MNRYTVAKATRGLAHALLHKNADLARQRGVAIAYDTRHNSRAFAMVAAAVLEKAGIPAHIYREAAPTPLLSFTVRHLGCTAGIVVTASHNPKEYNGYKVYDAEGCQLVPDQANRLIEHINATHDALPALDAAPRFVPNSVSEAYIHAVNNQSLYADADAKRALRIVYTPLHGAGNSYVPAALAADGFTCVHCVAAQQSADGDFPTVKSPNPEDSAALNMAIEQARAENADLVLGTDPDCDRVGAAVAHQGQWRLISGNQMGALLMDFILRMGQPLPANGAVVKTIVTNDLGATLARDAGLTVFDTLTGFKFIGEKIGEFERSGAHSFVFGYEESCGYLVGTYARDKDAVVACQLIAEMTALHKQEGRTLIDALDALYAKHGFYADALDAPVIESTDRIEAIMHTLRTTPGLFDGNPVVLDYLQGLQGLPKVNVLKYVWPGDTWLAVRPSGTEPKIKVYYSVHESTAEKADNRLNALRERVSALLG